MGRDQCCWFMFNVIVMVMVKEMGNERVSVLVCLDVFVARLILFPLQMLFCCLWLLEILDTRSPSSVDLLSLVPQYPGDPYPPASGDLSFLAP